MKRFIALLNEDDRVVIQRPRSSPSRGLRLGAVGAMAGLGGVLGDALTSDACGAIFGSTLGSAAGGALTALGYNRLTRRPLRSAGRVSLAGAVAGFGAAQVFRRLEGAGGGVLFVKLLVASLGGAATTLSVDAIVPPELRVEES